VPLFVLCLYGGVTRSLDGTDGGPVRAALFQTVTALSTTGYASVDLHQWHGLGWMLLILLMLIGGGVGSTAGGLKQYRIYALAQGVLWQIKGLFRAAGVVNQPVVWIGERRRFLSDRELRRIGIYLFFYLAVWLAGSAALTAFGHPPAASLFEFASTLGTVGLSVGVTSAAAHDGQLWVQICGMILGRLEFFVVFAGLFKIIGDLPALLRSRHRNQHRRQYPPPI
jgi:trk system potassium uptake protein TrkH